jgi:hypothetical protein
LNVGNRSTPLNAGEEFVRQVTGANGNCVIPADATGISYNLTVPTSINGFLTIFPADAARPLASSINPVSGESVKANGGIVGLSATGAIKVYTLTGPVDALLDITGYYAAAIGGAGGPPGPPGPRGFSAWDVIPSGQTVTGNSGFFAEYPLAANPNFAIQLPGKAPVALTTANVNFAPDGFAETTDDDPACTGTTAVPTAPSGKLCLYLYVLQGNPTAVNGFQANLLGDQTVYIFFTAAAGSTAGIFVTWAYTAP